MTKRKAVLSEMVLARIEELENNDTVVGAIKLNTGTVVTMEEMIIPDEYYSGVVALGTVSVEEYEENGYELDGLEYTWVQL